jgi:adenylate kinase
MSQGDLVPDEIMTDLLQTRLQETDCKVNGWVVDGYPKTADQALSLRQRGLAPSHVFFLQAPDAMVYERMDGRRLDPLTGKYYGPKNPPDKLEIQERLIQNPEDSHEVIRKRLDNYRQNLTKLQTEYRRVSTEVKADMDPKLLTELIGDSIENSVVSGFD